MNKVAEINPTGAEIQLPDTMPHSIEAEQQLLGAILTNNEIYDRVASIIKSQHFYEPVHARIFEVAAARITKNNLASPVTLDAFLSMMWVCANWVDRPIWRVWRVLRLRVLRCAITHS